MPTIDAANEEVLRRLLAGEPVLVDVIPAAQAIAGLTERMILHAGPPIEWERMCGPLRGAIMGIAVFEGWAKDLDDAARKAAAGAFAFHPNHHFGAVGPMTGMTTKSQPGAARGAGALAGCSARSAKRMRERNASGAR